MCPSGEWRVRSGSPAPQGHCGVTGQARVWGTGRTLGPRSVGALKCWNSEERWPSVTARRKPSLYREKVELIKFSAKVPQVLATPPTSPAARAYSYSAEAKDTISAGVFLATQAPPPRSSHLCTRKPTPAGRSLHSLMHSGYNFIIALKKKKVKESPQWPFPLRVNSRFTLSAAS